MRTAFCGKQSHLFSFLLPCPCKLDRTMDAPVMRRVRRVNPVEGGGSHVRLASFHQPGLQAPLLSPVGAG